MANQATFTPEEWTTVRNAPHAVAMAVMMAGGSGLLGSVKEAFSVGKVLMDGMQSQDEIVREISSEECARAFTDFVKASTAKLSGDEAKNWIRHEALSATRQAIPLVAAKAAPGEFEAYKNWIAAIGKQVSEAASEGGFLGFGGEQVSEAEKTFLAELETVLQLEGGSNTATAIA